MKEVSKWVGITGSWRVTSPEIEVDVRNTVREVISRGDGIVTGGAMNVDFQATDEALGMNAPKQVKVFLPTSLTIYAAHQRKRAIEGLFTKESVENLVNQLEKLQKLNPEGLIENSNNTIVDKETYYERNSEVVNASDELIAFQVNHSQGSRDAIDKARTKGIPLEVHTYSI